MEIKITKKDVIWNYLAQFFNLSSGLIVLPVVLHLLSSEEIGMNYLMLSVSSLVALVDFGFSDQFGRNITYVFSGAQELKREGMDDVSRGDINYHLLAVMIETAKYIYRVISIFSLIFMLTFGTIYMYRATVGFTTIDNAFLIWIIFSLSVFFGLYFKYYGALLVGAAMIMETKKASMLDRIAYIAISFFLLFTGCGLLSIAIAGLIAPFVGRWYSNKSFYRKELKDALRGIRPEKKEIKDLFNILWYNAKKLGINFLGAYGIQQSGTFILGLFLPLGEIASYGLMCQFVQIGSALSMGVFMTYLPVFYQARVSGDKEKLVRDFSFSSFVYISLFLFCCIFIIVFAPFVLSLIGSSTVLPVITVMVIYFIHSFLENFHSMCATMIVTNNKVPFVKAAIFSGIFIVLSNLLTLKYTTLGLLGVVLGQFIVQSAYNHWKWPLWIFNEFDLNIFKLTRIGFNEFCKQKRKLLWGVLR